MYPRHSGTVLDPAAIIPAQFSCSAKATFTGSVSRSPCLSRREERRRLHCITRTNLAICCFLACLLCWESGDSERVDLSLDSSLTPRLSQASASAMDIRRAYALAAGSLTNPLSLKKACASGGGGQAGLHKHRLHLPCPYGVHLFLVLKRCCSNYSLGGIPLGVSVPWQFS